MCLRMQKLVEESQKCKQISDSSDRTMKDDVSSLIAYLKKHKAFYVDNDLPPLIQKLPNTACETKPAYWRRITDLTNNDYVKQKDVCVCVCVFLFFIFIHRFYFV